MIVSSELEALSVAVEMEKRAIRIYERALLLVDNEQVKKGIVQMLSDEKRHLLRFEEMRDKKAEQSMREKQLIEAMASEMLFSGGVMEMERAKSLNSIRALYTFAAESEQKAVEQYTAFALKCANDMVRDAFLAVAREESAHFAALKNVLEQMEG